MSDQANTTSNLPAKCPNCSASMEVGFVHGGEDIVCWSRVNRNEVIEDFTKEVLYLQRKDRPKSFKFSGVQDPEPLKAVRCVKCDLVVFAYTEALNWKEFKKKK
ncbi:MAG: hypothetical protein DHS20C16_00540 [Phycisphaerae bacterium]|nr:MAG: hypothetical protein DHS20C16_00540 [Phycisphaerae bacterium]